MEVLKGLLSKLLSFTTGLNLFGLGLLAVAFPFWFIGWSHVAAGLAGAFVFRNFKAIVEIVENRI
jgi:hypothetical protein